MTTAVYFYDISLIAKIPRAISDSTLQNYSYVIGLAIVIPTVVIVGIILRRRNHAPQRFNRRELTYESQSSKETSVQPVHDYSKSQELKKDEESLLRSKGELPASLKKKDELIETEETVNRADEIIARVAEKIRTEGEYEARVMQDTYLRCLWVLLKKPDHVFESLTSITRAVYGLPANKEPSGSARENVSKGLNELKKYDLVEIVLRTEYQEPKKKKRTIDEFRITKRGMDLIMRARNEGVTMWNDFFEKYLTESEK
jgi:hypothetical protein